MRVDASSLDVRAYPLPAGRGDADLNTPVFTPDGTLWFTGQAGVYGRLVPPDGRVEVFGAPGGRGPYGVTATPDGTVYYASLAGSHVARPTRAPARRRCWSRRRPSRAPGGSGRTRRGGCWTSQWNAGQVAVHDPATGEWREWRLPGDRPQAYAVFVDHRTWCG